MWPVSSAFKAALIAPVHQIAVRIDILDTDFNTIASREFSPTKSVIDGAVDLDVTRANRRTFQMNLLNNSGEYSPGSELAGYFYIDRMVRLHRGIRLGSGVTELVPIGTFLIDKADVMVERNMSVVTLAGQDLWKIVAKSQFTSPTSYAKGTSINTVLADIAADAGVTRMTIDDLADRPTNSKTLNAPLNFEAGDKRGEVLQKLADDWGLEIFFNVMGMFVTRDMRDPDTSAVVWDYRPGENSIMTQLQATWDDQILYNHIFVKGTGDEKVTYTGEVRDDDPRSPTRISRIGDRTFRYESGVLASQDAVDKAALTLFYKHRALSESVRMEAICNPAFEGNDVVRVVEADYAKINRGYRLAQFSVPLATSKQTLHMNRVIQLT